MLPRFKDKHVLVTGGALSIGFEITPITARHSSLTADNWPVKNRRIHS